MSQSVLDELKAQRDELTAFLARYGASNPRVFGSVARRAEAPGSDVDLLIDMPPEAGLFRLAQLQIDLSDKLHRKVDLVTPGELHPRIRDAVLASAVPL